VEIVECVNLKGRIQLEKFAFQVRKYFYDLIWKKPYGGVQFVYLAQDTVQRTEECGEIPSFIETGIFRQTNIYKLCKKDRGTSSRD
jgi:hypothetical protein